MRGLGEILEMRLTVVETLMVVGTLIVETMMVVHEKDDLEFGVTEDVLEHWK